ncbi:hypothetical protein KQX54_019719 [Cotesia glomerata]|uniref:Uncharacterized protein n=1 Tax=Cotesia glomerata TaxID=32391 RepID=A0AAV7IJ79_COTGL|nr:hypothetical protein KQX54_019719 [Cotesia glomerata]
MKKNKCAVARVAAVRPPGAEDLEVSLVLCTRLDKKKIDEKKYNYWGAERLLENAVGGLKQKIRERLFLFLLLLFRTAVDPRDKLPPRVVPTRRLDSQEQKDSCNIARVLKVFAFGHVNSPRLYFQSLICTLLLFF